MRRCRLRRDPVTNLFRSRQFGRSIAGFHKIDEHVAGGAAAEERVGPVGWGEFGPPGTIEGDDRGGVTDLQQDNSSVMAAK